MIQQYIVDAFTPALFHGNPAAVCVMDQWPDEQLGKADIVAQQSSKRGGSLYCSVIDDKTLTIAGEAVLYAVSEIAFS